MTPQQASRVVRWFRGVLWLGIAANLALALPTFVAPRRIFAWTGLPVADPIVWPQFAGLLMILLSVFYVPAAINPARYRASAWAAVGARLVGVVFFLSQPSDYHPLAYFDLTFFVPEAILLTMASRAGALGADASGAVWA